jgi:hypothetical protein
LSLRDHVFGCVALQARLLAVAWKQWLGSDYLESNVFGHQVEIRIMVDKLQPMLGTGQKRRAAGQDGWRVLGSGVPE